MSITFADTKRGLAIICAVCHRSFVARRRTAQFCGMNRPGFVGGHLV
jgi:hypothetical protein